MININNYYKRNYAIKSVSRLAYLWLSILLNTPSAPFLNGSQFSAKNPKGNHVK